VVLDFHEEPWVPVFNWGLVRDPHLVLELGSVLVSILVLISKGDLIWSLLTRVETQDSNQQNWVIVQH